jgi:hypothetical protein
MFSLRTINNKMNMELQKFIKEKLGIQDSPPEEALETLAKKKGELAKVITQIELLESQLAKNCCHAWAEQLTKEKDFQGKGHKPIPGDSSVYLYITLSRTKIAIGLEKRQKNWGCCVWVNTKEGGELPKPVINKIEHLLNVKNKTWPNKDVDTCKDAYSLFKRVIKALTE